MDEFDKKLYYELNSEIEIPNEFSNIIKNSLNNEKVKRKLINYSLTKIISVACASLVLTAGIAYASTEIVKNIWKEPEKVVSNNNIITAEEKAKCMTEEEATTKANEILKKMGYNNEKIKSATLEKSSYKKIDCRFETESKISLSFSADGKDGFWLFNSNVLKKDIKNYRTTKEEAEKTARKICEKYGYDLSNYTNVSVNSNVEQNNAYIWYVDFSKEYNGLINGYEEISVAFIPEINEIYYFTVNTSQYDNNTVEIEKEEAINTALEAEKNTKTGYEVKCLDAYLSIKKMNSDAYLRMNNYKQYIEQQYQEHIEYFVEQRIRKVWKVVILLNKKNEDICDFCDTYAYYIDTTTGEIIGGTSTPCDIYVTYGEDGKKYVYYSDYETGKIIAKEPYVKK